MADSGIRPMEPRCRVALLKSRQALIRDLDVEPAVDRLMSELVITTADSRKILAEGPEHKKRRVLLDLLPKRGQRAYDVFLDHLGQGEYSQPWLRETISDNLQTVTQEELDGFHDESQQLCRGGPTTDELQQALRRNLEKYIANDPSRILEEVEAAEYVYQPIQAHKIVMGKNREQMPFKNILELFQTFDSRGQRVFVYGEAGMGKSSLCRHIAQIWARGQSILSKQFDYVFPISLRTVRSRSLVDIVCSDADLIPETCKQRIEQEIELKSVLFILDSFEELSHEFETPEINRLLKRERYPNSSVLITARPGRKLEEEEEKSMPCVKANLENLTEEQVQKYLETYPGLKKDLPLRMKMRFGIEFLSRPINLWLLCLSSAQITTSAVIPDTQTVLLNTIIQHLMMAYGKKKKLSNFDISQESPMENAPTEVKLLLEKVGQFCFYNLTAKSRRMPLGLNDNSRSLRFEDGVLSKADVMPIGLFSEGEQDNTVTLPHPLFQEYLAALYLSVDKRARQDLFAELRKESERTSFKRSLLELLRDHGLDNMVRFLVGLLPSATEDLCGLLLIKQYKKVLVMSSEPHMTRSDINFELDLLKECSCDVGKSMIATELLKAPVLLVDGAFLGVRQPDSHLFLRYFNEAQQQEFLQKFYGCQVCSNELIQAPGSKEFWLDSFVVGMIYLNDYTVRVNKACIRDCQVPVKLLTERLTAVEKLTLELCTLQDFTDQQLLAFFNLTQLSNSTRCLPRRIASELQLDSVTLWYSRGINLFASLGCTLPSTRRLSLTFCGDVNLGSLCRCFTGVTEVDLLWSHRVYSDTENEWTSVRRLTCNNSDSETKPKQLIKKYCPQAACDFR